MTSRNVALTVAAAFAAASVTWSFAGCSLPTSGLPGKDAGAPCDSPGQCDDLNSCTTDTCDSGRCSNTAVVDGDGPAQRPGDCVKIACAAGNEEPVIDLTDVASDGNDCT